MSTLGERIKQIRGKLSQAEFAEKTGINKSTLGRYERNVNKPDTASINAICKIFKVNSSWLLTGEGRAFFDDSSVVSDTDELLIVNSNDADEYADIVTNIDNKKYNFNYDILINIRKAFIAVLKEKGKEEITKTRFDTASILLYYAFIEMSLRIVQPLNIEARIQSFDMDGNLVDDNLKK